MSRRHRRRIRRKNRDRALFRWIDREVKAGRAQYANLSDLEMI